ADKKLDAADPVVRVFRLDKEVPVGGSALLGGPNEDAPAPFDFPEGPGALIAVADDGAALQEEDEANNALLLDHDFFAAPARPVRPVASELVVTSVASPTFAIRSEPLGMVYTVQNRLASLPGPLPFGVDLFLSPTARPDPETSVFLLRDFPATFSATTDGATQSFLLPIRLVAPNLVAGRFFLFLRVKPYYPTVAGAGGALGLEQGTVAFLDSDSTGRTILVATDACVGLTTDGGESFRLFDAATLFPPPDGGAAQAARVTAAAFAQKAPGQMLVGSTAGAALSTDDGKTWRRFSAATHPGFPTGAIATVAIAPATAASGPRIAVGGAEGAALSADGGVTFQPLAGLPAVAVRRIEFHPGDPAGNLLLVATAGGAALSRDGGATFARFTAATTPGFPSDDVAAAAFHGGDVTGNTFLAATAAGARLTVNGGVTFTAPAGAPAGAVPAGDFLDAPVAAAALPFVIGTAAGAFVTRDGGATFTERYTAADTAIPDPAIRDAAFHQGDASGRRLLLGTPRSLVYVPKGSAAPVRQVSLLESQRTALAPVQVYDQSVLEGNARLFAASTVLGGISSRPVSEQTLAAGSQRILSFSIPDVAGVDPDEAQIMIVVSGNGFDAVADLLDSTGRLIAQSDDSPGSLDPVIYTPLSAVTPETRFYLIVSSVGEHSGSRDFSVLINANSRAAGRRALPTAANVGDLFGLGFSHERNAEATIQAASFSLANPLREYLFTMPHNARVSMTVDSGLPLADVNLVRFDGARGIAPVTVFNDLDAQGRSLLKPDAGEPSFTLQAGRYILTLDNLSPEAATHTLTATMRVRK
ncbi:MAG: hypothetical protein HY719_00140, partial [Planctomycetes bacterium]|nr:hypothetical protein [Planctomycetota bacterium]